MIARNNSKRALIDVTGQPKPIVGLPDGVLKYRCRFRLHQVPLIFLRFSDRIQKHVLLCSGENLEPFETPSAVNSVHSLNP